MKLAVNHS